MTVVVFVDASAMVALMTGELEAGRIEGVLASARTKVTSPIAVLETALALARPDKFNRSIQIVEPLLHTFLDQRGIEVRDMPPAAELSRLSLLAADRFKAGRRGLNLGDCLHYACAKHYGVPILATADEFRMTDLDVLP